LDQDGTKRRQLAGARVALRLSLPVHWALSFRGRNSL
jgi:hypothetical protein